MVVSNDILSEYEEKISEKSSKIVSHNILDLLLVLENVEKQNVYYKWNLISADYDDNKFVDCAIAGKADYIVTNDRHFRPLKKVRFPKTNVIDLNEFVTLLNK